MFTDGRSKRVLFVAHCLLNQNAISDGTADYPACHADIVRMLLDAQVGIVQMNCPELCCLGLDRGDVHGAERAIVVENTRIRRQMQQQPAAGRLQALVEQVLWQISEYEAHGFTVCGIVGMNRSPCCGVDTTSDRDQEIAGQGVFISAIQSALQAAGYSIPRVGIKAGPEALERIRTLL